MRIVNTLKGLKMMVHHTKVFHPVNHFRNKRIAVIGAADSAFEKENGQYIDNFDYIIRINKAPHSLGPGKYKFIGSRTDILFHSFYENTESGGGPIDFDLYEKQGIEFLINPNNSFNGLRVLLSYFKRNLSKAKVYILPRSYYKDLTKNFGSYIPTIGYSALYTALNSQCKEVFITGFTFFKTPYADDYRDHFKDMNVNNNFIESQGIHNPDLELREFTLQLESSNAIKIVLDNALQSIVDNYKNYKKEI